MSCKTSTPPRLLNTAFKSAFLSTAMVATSLMATAPLSADTTQSIENAVVATDGKLALEVSKGKLIKLAKPAEAVFVANPKIADVQVKSSRLVYVYGVAEGETSFYALDADDNTIYSADLMVKRSLGDLRSAIDQMLPGNRISVSNLGNMIMLQGDVNTPEESATAEDLAASILQAKVLNKIAITQPTQVNLRVRIAEVSRDVVKQLGIRWQSMLSSGNALFGVFNGAQTFVDSEGPGGLPVRNYLPAQNGYSILGGYQNGNLDLNGIIDALDTEGFITVLAEPNLTAKTGSEASFLAGGEYPIPVPSRDGIAIEYREFGVKLKFTPTVMNSGSISLNVAPEVSDLSSAGAIQVQGISIPSITTRKTSTTVELGSGQSFAIAGLIQNRQTTENEKVPGFGDIPILGALFRSKAFRNNETELLIVVTPYLVEAVNNDQLVLPTDGYIAPSDMEQFMKDQKWKTTPTEKGAKKAPRKGPTLKKRAGFKVN